MNSITSRKVTKLFDIVAGWNSLLGTFTKGERLTVNVVRYDHGNRGGVFFKVEVTNAAGNEVNSILKWALTRKTAVGWAHDNFAHERTA